MAETVTQLLAERATDDNLAITHDDRQWSWREYIADAECVAAAVLGLADRSRPMHIGTLLGNTPDMLIALAAGALGGYVTVGVNNTRRGEGLAADILRADCQILVTDAEHRPLLDGLDLPGVTILDTSSPDWARLLDDAGELEPYSVPGAADTFMLIFTSGTSGNPKPVQFAHMMIPFAGPVLVDKYDIGPGDVCYLSMPLFHSAALMGGYCVALCGGAAMAPAKFSASTFLHDIRRYGATYMNYVGKPLAYILATEEQPDDADNPLRVAFGNEATDRDIDEFSRRFGATVWDGFGSTELAIIITREPGTPHGSIGKGFPNVAVYNSETIAECPRAEFDDNGALANADEAIGELVNIEGAGMFMGYYNDADATNERIRHGMYWSGDLAYKDADDWIYLAGRTGDWMRVDGENMAAGPIERILLRLPEINRVAVYAVPDEHVGDAVMAAVVLGDGAELTPESFAEQLAAQPDLSPKAWPRYVRIADDLPTTATNKILKRTLKQEGAVAGDGTLWVREARTSRYRPATATPATV
ncbi:fatty-acid--CoA ligase FadD1 [Gordonia sp. CPCC 206044]|uniref:fatty-acid--CoA ligase FadD1 n=1 Tax=Gordonia sp. CPCC 206044 TaxID=3140793 RepID=UPI003AF35C4B